MFWLYTQDSVHQTCIPSITAPINILNNKTHLGVVYISFFAYMPTDYSFFFCNCFIANKFSLTFY